MNIHSAINPPLPRPADNRLSWGALAGSARALAITRLAEQYAGTIVLIAPDVNLANRLTEAISFFSPDLKILQFPDWETLPYDHFSPHKDLISERMQTLYQLSNINKGIVVAALPTLMHKLMPKDFLLENTLFLKIGNALNLHQFRDNITHTAYRHVEQVMEHGEYALRGSILDIFPMGSKLPFRIELFDEEIESIRQFDPENQRTINKIESISLLPAREYPLTTESIERFRQNWRAKFSGNPLESPIYANVSKGEIVSGVEYYLPLFFEKTETFFDYLAPNTLIAHIENLNEPAESFYQEINERYEQLRYDVSRPILTPNEIFLSIEEFFSKMKIFPKIEINKEIIKEKPGQTNFNSYHFPSLLIDNKKKQPLQALEHFIENNKTRILFCAETQGRREVLLDLLKEINIKPKQYQSWQEYINDTENFGITVAALEEGMWLIEPKIAVITESQLFGEHVQQRRLRKQRHVDPESMVRSLTELKIGDPVVHIEHGVGRYRGLQIIATSGVEAEYLTLEYEGGDKIYVPVASLHLISRYTGANSEHAPLSRLGTKRWEKTKEKAAQKVYDVAAELLEIYSKRQASIGFALSKANSDYQLFANAFPFEETPDQAKAIEEVTQDMLSPRCMDRLVCGDVGFGKTEVAMRAAFLAAHNGKQVALLVPTTLLAAQHLQNFRDRFAGWPMKIVTLSRMQSSKEQEIIIEALSKGKIDIVIGTHKLLQPNIHFKDLGLLIVDEEHRFGVRQKEKIKALRAHVDILTLTATPIPRTLNLAMAGTRDLSIIMTPPARRLSIKTFIHEENTSIIREAILRETMRGGQVYFLHNEVKTIAAIAEKIKKIVPEARLAIAHGQMRERELEQIMSDFYHQKFNLLVCTTIIESGIDIPTANTIIINKANKFGLAQLHQLRGRVGRSHHQAYAYLLIADRKAISNDAKKRLTALTELEDLGAGFNLAMHDLEIRGAGELLGDEQSGHIQEIGFSLYTELLELAIKALKKGEKQQLDTTFKSNIEIDLHVSALLPESYVPDVHNRLMLYKRLTSCKTFDDIQGIKAELVDRFGPLPLATTQLLKMSELKLLAEPLGIQKIDAGKSYGYLHFNEKPNIDPKKIIELIQKSAKDYQLQGANKLRFAIPENNFEKKIDQIQKLLVYLE